jgi:hemerythrin-like domain-containing protein
MFYSGGMKMKRRNFLGGIAGLSAGLILGGCSDTKGLTSMEKSSLSNRDEEAKGAPVTATEDLMREHGILRRVLFVYSDTAEKLRHGDRASLLENLHKAAGLFQSFGEDYHEKKLEEAYIFPLVKKSHSQASGYPDILTIQHNRGREITNYILSVTQNAKLNDTDAEHLAGAMKSMVRMYRAHAAKEDTVVFPAWKETLSEEQLDDMGEMFEHIEHQQFGKDGFETAVRQIASIETELGLADISQFTAGPIV